MASAEADPLANSEEMGTNSNENDNFDVSMLSEQDIQLIKKMQMLKSMGLSQSRPHGRVVTNKSLPGKWNYLHAFFFLWANFETHF